MPLYGETSLIGRSHLYRDNSDGEDTKFLRSALRRIDRWARDAKIKRPKKRMIIRSAEKQWEIIDSPKNQIIMLPGTAVEWKKSFEMRRIIFGILFRSRFDLGMTDKPEKHPLPVWMSAATDEAMASRLSNEQYFSGNKDYLALQMIFKRKNRLPGFAALCKFDRLPSDPASREVFSQMSLLLMELAAENGLLTGMLEDHCADREPDSWIVKFSNSREVQARLSDLALKALWNHRTPPPEELLREKMDSLHKIVLPELDPKQVPTGKMLDLTIAGAHELLRKSKRPDLAEIRRYYSREWNRFGFRQSQAVRQLCGKLSEAAAKIGEDEDQIPLEFEKLFVQLQQQLSNENRVMRELLLKSFHALPLDQLYPLHFRILESGGEAASTAAVRRFLEESEKKYLENY